jgi:hypothetical protein
MRRDVNCLILRSEEDHMAMSKGDHGPGVVLLQTKLNEWIQREQEAGRHANLAKLVVDGIYGHYTALAVAAFQVSVPHLSPTSQADGDTLEALGLSRDTTATNTLVVHTPRS